MSMFYYDLMRVYFQDNKDVCYVNVDSSVSVNIDGLHDSPKELKDHLNCIIY
jgi:hypothetical protein